MYTVQNILSVIDLHLGTTDGRIGLTYACKQQSEILVYLSRCPDGTARIAGYDLLLYGYGWWQSLDIVALRLAETSEKLTCVCRQRLYIAPLSFGIECVESQR